MTEHEALTVLMRKLVVADELTMKLRWALRRGNQDEIESVRGDLTMALGEVARAISTWEVVVPPVHPCLNCAGTGFVVVALPSGYPYAESHEFKLLCRDCSGSGERDS